MRAQLRLAERERPPALRAAGAPNVGSSHAATFSVPKLTSDRAQMFVGEMGCWLFVACFALFRRVSRRGYEPLPNNDDANPALKPLVGSDGRKHLKGWSILLLALPACCDITGTTLMNAGFLFVAASIYQMTRGALVLFVGLFSVLFLKRRLYLHQWLALVVVMLGVGLVGVAGALDKHPQAKPEPRSIETAIETVRLMAREIKSQPEALQTVIGVLMIAGAQIFTATQFVLEEFILEKCSVEPLKMVGWEGVFGFTVTFLAMVLLHFTVGVTDAGRYGYFDAVEGWRQFIEYRSIAVSSVLIMISIGGFNFFGLSVTRSVSATSRSTIDTCRTLFIWIVSLGLRWETFKWLQIVGFVLLVYGTFLFNDIIGAPWHICVRKPKAAPLLAQEPVEHL